MRHRSRFSFSLPLLICSLFFSNLSCGQAAPADPPPEGTPRLVVVVVADQFRYDYLERARPFFTGGLARLLDGGVSFTRAHHGHGRTWTAPGHASLATGVHPARSGIPANEFYDRRRPDEPIYCVEDDRFGTSPKNLLVPALGDWIKERYPESKVVAAAGKDRGAVLLGGHDADAAFWYDADEGRFATSGYYLPEEPEWLAAFNEAGPPDAFLDAWRPLTEVDPAAAAAAGFAPMDRGPFDRGFPRLIGDSVHRDDDFREGIYDSPFLDQWLGRLAPELVARYELGADEWPDLLVLAFSSLDTVGHDYGPHSPEVLDTLVRLDRLLGELFAAFDERMGIGAYVVAFSSDHGVVPLPERTGEPAHRIGVDEVLCLRRAAAGFAERHGGEPWMGAPWYLDHSQLRGDEEEKAAAVAAAQTELEQRLAACPGVRRVWTANRLAASRADVRAAEPGSDAWYEALYRNGHHPERSPDVQVQWQPLFLPAVGSHTNHGSPYAYDTHVPMLLLAPGLAPAEIDDLVLTVDLAPTLAALLDVPVPEEIDGVERISSL
jgi:predicted AlkP superfamily pyrophosphatase or phosphodiesterase